MDTIWFEMKDIRKRRISNSVWIPLRTVETISTKGKYGHPGYQNEFFGAGSLAIPFENREAAKQLSWSDIGISRQHGVWATKEFYKTADLYQHHNNDDFGMDLVLVQNFDGAEVSEWHLNQDVIFALSLFREGDNWVRPNEDYIVVARLRRDINEKPISIEIKNEFLREYLCARKRFLRITSYRSRDAILETSAATASIKKMSESANEERFELRTHTILEGGHLKGTFAVFNIARTDIDSDEDVPIPGPETNDNIETKSWQGRREGKEYARIEGEFWRDEEIEPSDHSIRIRRDDIPTGISYIVDASGAKMTSEELYDQDIGRWIWFKPDVVVEILKHRGSGFRWYTGETGGISCGPGSLIHFGLNSLGLVTIYAYDIAKLDLWQQRIWAGYNVAPEGGVSKELLSAQMRTIVAETSAPEKILEGLIEKIDPLFEQAIGSKLFRPYSDLDKLHKTISRFRTLEPNGLFSLAKDIMRLIADRIDISPLQKAAPPPPKEKWGSLKSLEKYLATISSNDEARKLMGPLFGIYELRIADAHLAKSDLGSALTLAGINPDSHPLEQGYNLINNAAEAVWAAGDIVYKHICSKSEMSDQGQICE